MAVYHIAQDAHLKDLDVLQSAQAISVFMKMGGEQEDNPFKSKPLVIELFSGEDRFILEATKLNMTKALIPIFTTSTPLKVFRSAKIPVKHLLHHYQIGTKGVFCCALATRLLTMGNKSERAELATVLQPIGDKLKALEQMTFATGDAADERFGVDGDATSLIFELYRVIAARLAHHKLKKVSSLEFRTVLPVAAMELRGIYADPERLQQAKAQIESDMDAIQSDLLKELKGPEGLPGVDMLNLNSPEQVKSALAEKGIQVSDTAESRLKPFANQYPFIGQLLEFRRLGRLLSAITSQLIDFIQPQTGRIHATYHQIASPSGRFACTSPNIQQIPRESLVRSCIRPQPGYAFIVADYSQVELRVAAGISGDQLMLNAYHNGQDLHKLTAAITMNKAAEMVTKEERQAAKAINFGLIYAMGARGLQQSAKASYGVDMTHDQAQMFRNRYFENYSGIRNWQRDTEQFGRKNGYVRTAAGRIRSYRQEALRVNELLNIPVQGTAAEGLKSALCIFWDEVNRINLEASIVAIIHDEIIVEVLAEQAEQAKTTLEKAMVAGIQWLVPQVPFSVDAVIAESWAEK